MIFGDVMRNESHSYIRISLRYVEQYNFTDSVDLYCSLGMEVLQRMLSDFGEISVNRWQI